MFSDFGSFPSLSDDPITLSFSNAIGQVSDRGALVFSVNYLRELRSIEAHHVVERLLLEGRPRHAIEPLTERASDYLFLRLDPFLSLPVRQQSCQLCPQRYSASQMFRHCL